MSPFLLIKKINSCNSWPALTSHHCWLATGKSHRGSKESERRDVSLMNNKARLLVFFNRWAHIKILNNISKDYIGGKGVAGSCEGQKGREEKQQSSLLKHCGREGFQHELQASGRDWTNSWTTTASTTECLMVTPNAWKTLKTKPHISFHCFQNQSFCHLKKQQNPQNNNKLFQEVLIHWPEHFSRLKSPMKHSCISWPQTFYHKADSPCMALSE